ncbi:MAG: NADH-quinone oxidoreductase subunit J [Gemmatimonadota bacterium]
MVTFAFWLFSGVAIVSAFLCITRRSPVASALWLVNTFFSIAALFIILDAHFLAAVQVLVYAGAIMVLFLFVIMLLNLGRPGPGDMKGWWGRGVAGVAGLVLVGELLALRLVVLPAQLVLPAGTVANAVQEQGAVQAVATPLFQAYLVPFEIASLMLLVAIVGAVVLAKRRV